MPATRGTMGINTSVEMASLRFLGSPPKSGHYFSINFHDGESDGWHIFPSNSLSCACQMRSFTIVEEWNILLKYGIGGKYYMTLPRTHFLVVVLKELIFTLKLHKKDMKSHFLVHSYLICNHSNIYVSFHNPFLLYNMQSFEHVYIFSYSIPNAFKVVFAPFIDSVNSLLRGNISPMNPNNSFYHVNSACHIIE